MSIPFKALVAVIVLGVNAWALDEPAGKPAETDNPYFWKSHVTSVAVFKNGLGFFLRDGDVALHDGWCSANEVPPAQFGTLAFFSHAPNEVVDVVGAGPGEVVEFNGVDAPKDLTGKRARLEASKELKLQITYSHKDAERTVSGKLMSVGPEFAVLENDGANVAVALEEITKIQGLDQPLRLHVAGAQEKTTLGMAYLRKGITWVPEYTLKVLDSETAELSLRGTLINEAEDLVHCDVNFVVGVPHFVHTDYMAPIAVGQTIRTIGAAVAPKAVMSQMSNAFVSKSFPSDSAAGGENAEDASRAVREELSNLPQMEGPGSTDFTVYTKKDLTVRRGEKAVVTLFVKKITYAHRYRWSIPGELEHFLVLPNQTDTAWATGPCLALQQGNPLSEDLFRYVPKGGSGELAITTAVNIVQDKTETEVDRKLKAYEPSHNDWLDLVTLQGELKIHNMEKTAAEVVVNLPVCGKPLESSDNGAVTIDTDKLKLVERSSSIRWTVKIAAGETKSITYKYERYVPSR